MLYVLIALLIVSLVTCRYRKFNQEYITRESTNTVKGFFTILVLLSHIRGAYLGEIDAVSACVLKYVGQLMVTMFFFYSGYGIFESFQTKPNYGERFFKNRVVKTVVHFDIALLLYLALSLLLHQDYPIRNYITCWIGFDSIGNSDWFIFATLVLYLGVWLFRKLAVTKPLQFIGAIAFFSLAYIAGMVAIGRDSYWYNTILCFPVGMLYSMYKKQVEKCLNKGYFGVLLVCVLLFAVSYYLNRIWAYIACSCFFAVAVVLISVKIQNRNPLLAWFGKHVFEIYILQRIPMILLNSLNVKNSDLLYTSAVLAATVLLAAMFEKIENIADRKMFAVSR